MGKVQDEIDACNTDIRVVDEQIRAIEIELKTPVLSEGAVTYLRDKERQLRDKERQLRDKEKMLLARRERLEASSGECTLSPRCPAPATCQRRPRAALAPCCPALALC